MRKLFVMAFAISLVMAFAAGSAVANGGGGHNGNGKPCPPNSPGGGGNHDPGCGHGGGHHGRPCKDNDHNDRHKCPPGHGCKRHCPKPPPGNCEEADLVIFEPAKIVCLYLPPNGDLATKEEDCPDAQFASGPFLGGGLCIFLPPNTDGGGSPSLPKLPDPPKLPGLPKIPGLSG